MATKSKRSTLFWNLNDYELLYLVSWHSEEALDLIMLKYDTLIHKLLKNFHIKEYHYEDYYQECRLTLFESIKLYDENYNKTFCRFVELLITRKIMKLLYYDERAHKGVITSEVLVNTCEEKDDKAYDDLNNDFYLRRIKEFEMSVRKESVLRDVIVREQDVNLYASNNNLSLKNVYNDVYRVRKTLKEIFKNQD